MTYREGLLIAWLIILGNLAIIASVRGEPAAQAVYVVGLMLLWRLPDR